MECYHCHKFGHIRSKCPLLRSQSQEQSAPSVLQRQPPVQQRSSLPAPPLRSAHLPPQQSSRGQQRVQGRAYVRFVTLEPCFRCLYMFLKHICVLVFGHYSSNTIHRHYSLARGALSARCLVVWNQVWFLGCLIALCALHVVCVGVSQRIG